MKNIIAAGDKTTVEAAREIFWVGGNAFDAAVGAMFTAMVAEPALTSAGGGGHLMALPEGGRPILFDFFTDMPGGKVRDSNIDFFGILINFGTAKQEFHIGKGAVAVPGTVAGLLHVQSRLGVLSRKDVLAPAVRAAREGVVLSDMQAFLVSFLEPILTHEERGQNLYAPNGVFPKGGDRFAMPELADFLDTLAHEGPDLMYRGEVARIMVQWSKDGGLLREEDLANYRVKERTPICTNFHDHAVLLNPPPASSGILVDVSLSLLEQAGCTRKGPITLKDLVTAFDVTNRIRHKHLAGGTREPLTEQEFFPSYLETFRRLSEFVDNSSTTSMWGSTTHLSILDKRGNAASVTNTNGEGCGYVLPETGFMLNNMLGEEDLNPDGFHRHPAGVRLPSMVAPTIVMSGGSATKGGVPVLVTGTAGSNRIRSVIVQMIVNILCNGIQLQQATDFPRLHLEGKTLHAEPGFSEDDLVELEKRYDVQRWPDQNLFFGGAHSAAPDGGAGDARRSGFTLVC